MEHHCHSHASDPIVPGSDFVELTDTPLSTEQLTALVSSTKAGAISTFLGVTRDHHAGKKVPNYSILGLLSFKMGGTKEPILT